MVDYLTCGLIIVLILGVLNGSEVSAAMDDQALLIFLVFLATVLLWPLAMAYFLFTWFASL